MNGLDYEILHFEGVAAMACNKIEVVLLFDGTLVGSARPTRFSFDF
jgi:hypothetical protein